MAMVKCKECGNKISKKAKACPECGAPNKKGTSLTTFFVLLVIIFIAFGSINSNSPGTNSSSPKATSNYSVAEKLAIIDGNAGREGEYNRLLSGLMVKFGDTRIGVSDTAVRGTQVMKEHKNVQLSALEFLAAMDKSIPVGMKGINCAEIAAAFIALTDHR